MTAGDESDFIVPPPGMVQARVKHEPAPSVAADDDDVIDLPPGIVDSGTFRMPQPSAQIPAHASAGAGKPDIPAFFPAGAPAVAAEAPASAEPVEISGPAKEQRYAPPRLEDAIASAPRPAPPSAGTAAVSTAPVTTSSNATDEAIDEETRFAAPEMAAPAAPPAVVWRLTFPDGTQLVLDRTTLIGRDPAANARFPNARLLPVSDPSKSVSKTHVALQVTADSEVLVHDLHSTNGVYVVASGAAEIVVSPGSEQLLSSGAQVRLGQFAFLIERS
ncbi:FHA domain-containing protein [Rhodoglobus sp. NPDC076762]